jgi:hypothetical protein
MVLLNLEALEKQHENQEKIEKIKDNITKSQIKEALQPKKIKPMRVLKNSQPKANKFEVEMEKYNIQKLINQTKQQDIILQNNTHELSSNLVNIVNDVITYPHKNRQKFKECVQNSKTMQTILKNEIENYSYDNMTDRNIFGLLYMSYYAKAMI